MFVLNRKVGPRQFSGIFQYCDVPSANDGTDATTDVATPRKLHRMSFPLSGRLARQYRQPSNTVAISLTVQVCLSMIVISVALAAFYLLLKLKRIVICIGLTSNVIVANFDFF